MGLGGLAGKLGNQASYSLSFGARGLGGLGDVIKEPSELLGFSVYRKIYKIIINDLLWYWELYVFGANVLFCNNALGSLTGCAYVH